MKVILTKVIMTVTVRAILEQQEQQQQRPKRKTETRIKKTLKNHNSIYQYNTNYCHTIENK